MANADCWVINPEFCKGYDKELIGVDGRIHVFVPELGLICTIGDTYPDHKEAVRGKEAINELGKLVKGQE